MKYREIILTISAKPLGVGAAFQPLMPTGEQSGLLTLIAAESGFIVRADEKLTAFVELERQVLTVTFYLESIHDDSCGDQ